jgi:hypothetical protein
VARDVDDGRGGRRDVRDELGLEAARHLRYSRGVFPCTSRALRQGRTSCRCLPKNLDLITLPDSPRLPSMSG